jgi:hypothetical protein
LRRRATRRLSSAHSRRKSYKQWKGWRADPELDYRSNMASRVPIAAMLLRMRMASKSDRNSLIKCSHLLYTNRTAECAFRQTRMSSKAGAGGTESMRREMLFSKSWRKQHEKGGKGCGPIRSRCHRGSGDGVEDDGGRVGEIAPEG